MHRVTTFAFLVSFFLSCSVATRSVAACSSNKINVGTVLFTDSDLAKKCWTPDELGLLMSRMILEEVLPEIGRLKVDENERFVSDVVNYFRTVLEVVRKMTTGKIRHIMMLAATDLLGGYLNHIVLPIAKYAYYAGKINFDSMQKLLQLFDELKCFLRTSGIGWAHPIQTNAKNMKIDPILINGDPHKGHPCEGLIYTEKEHFEHNKLTNGEKCSGNVDIEVPMPFLDSQTKPAAIAVPFRAYSMRNIESKAATSVLVKYFVVVHKCFTSKSIAGQNVANFDKTFFAWIKRFVLPHLNEDKFYSGFGGVLRVYETLRQNGMKKTGSNSPGNDNSMLDSEINNQNAPKEQDMEKGELVQSNKQDVEKSEKEKKSSLVIYAFLIVIFVWFLLGSLFICYRIRVARIKKSCECPDMTTKPSSQTSTNSQSKISSKQSQISESDDNGKQRKKTPRKPTICKIKRRRGTDASDASPSTRSRRNAIVSLDRKATPRMGVQQNGCECKEPMAACLHMPTKTSSHSQTTPSAPTTAKRSTKGKVMESQCDSAQDYKTHAKGERCKDVLHKMGGWAAGWKGRNKEGAKTATEQTMTEDTTTTAATQSIGESRLTETRSSSGSYSGRQSQSQEYSSTTSSSTSGKEESAYDPVVTETKTKKIGSNTPAIYACHSSITGKYNVTSTTDATSSSVEKKPCVFGYDFQTSSSETTPRAMSDIESEIQGNMSK